MMADSGLTVGVVTHERATLFADMLTDLRAAVRRHGSPVTVIVVNNTGAATRTVVESLIDDSMLADDCAVTLIDSPQNNLSVARNLILDACRTRLLAFIDDDETPRIDWLDNLVHQHAVSDCAVVAGPILPVYPVRTARWIREVDLHNTVGRKTGDMLRRTASGNCLLDLRRIGDDRFDVDYGLSGGEDGDFFEGLSRRGETLVWCADAVVEETITANRTTARYILFRFLKQGSTFARFMLKDAGTVQRVTFYGRALVLAPVGILGGLLLLAFHPKGCARCWKGGFTNLGKLLRLQGSLYGQVRAQGGDRVRMPARDRDPNEP